MRKSKTVHLAPRTLTRVDRGWRTVHPDGARLVRVFYPPSVVLPTVAELEVAS